jgi:hypothetical protein
VDGFEPLKLEASFSARLLRPTVLSFDLLSELGMEQKLSRIRNADTWDIGSHHDIGSIAFS